MDFKVLIADSAITDLKEIVEFVAQDDADAATRLGNKIYKRRKSVEVALFRIQISRTSADFNLRSSTRSVPEAKDEEGVWVVDQLVNDAV